MFHAAARWSNHIQKFAHNNLTPLSYSSLLKIAPHNTNWIVILGDFKKMGEIALTPHHKILGFKQNYVIIQETKQFKSQQPIRIKCQAVMNQTPSTYSSKMSTDIPFYEIPGASFDQYLEDKPRVFEAIFPDKRRYQQLNEEEWRVHMLPIQFLFLTVLPVVDMRLRCKTNGKDYPSGIPPVISKVLELDIVRWQLQGLDNVVQPTHFNLGVNGALYSDRRGMKSRLKGQLEMKISVILPPVLSLVPEDVRQSVSESVLSRLVENMKDKVNGSLLADYGKFRRERQMNEVQLVESRKDGNL